MVVSERVDIIIITPMSEIPVWVENLVDPENSSNCVTTAPTVPPLPVIPDITPIDLHQQTCTCSILLICS
ncbi:hypothetical protein Hanom_Chr14g01308451 [Helianthus anomalus]